MNEENTINILIATDNHLGFMEKDPIRSQDSFLAFQEILHLAKSRNVDLILQGGDLFHENKPSRKTIYQTIELLREYCLGDKPSHLEYLSDPSLDFSHKFANINYLDPNINVSFPFFAIHGNHDDPSGDSNLCALDILSVSGLVNFFGKVKDVDSIEISPVLLAKGTTKLALYGLGSIRDERLYRLFQRKKVKMLRPTEDTDSWFNLFVIHQNRVSHGPTNFIPEQFLDEFIHYVVWGHEHECLIEPTYNAQKNFYVSQPGSSIATSLSDGESKQKHVCILKIQNKSFEMEKIPLCSVRVFLIKEISLSDYPRLGLTESLDKLNEFLISQVESLLQSIHETEKRLGKSPRLELCKPLIRLKVDYSGGYLSINPQRFGQQFVSKVANPKSILLFHRKRSAATTSNSNAGSIKNSDERNPNNNHFDDQINVEKLVLECLDLQSLELLPQNELADAVRKYIEKDDRDAIQKFINESLNRIRETLKNKGLPTQEIILKEEIEKDKRIREELWKQSYFNNTIDETQKSSHSKNLLNFEDDFQQDDEML